MRTLSTGPLVAVLVAVLVAIAGGCSDETADTRGSAPSTSPADGTSTLTPTATPTAPPPPVTPSATPTATQPAGPVAVRVYFVGLTPTGPRLFAELRTVDGRHTVDQALAALDDGPRDPDYASYLRPGRLRLASFDESAVLVAPDRRWATRPEGMNDQRAWLALQQVVLTVQAAMGRKIPVGFVTPHNLGTVTGGFFGLLSPPNQNGYVATTGTALLGQVNVLAPSEGQSVSGSLHASGMAQSFEGTVGWQIFDSTGRRVLDYSTQQRRGYLRRLSAWRTTIDISSLDPGRYTFVALTDSGSTEGPGPTRDTKTIIVS